MPLTPTRESIRIKRDASHLQARQHAQTPRAANWTATFRALSRSAAANSPRILKFRHVRCGTTDGFGGLNRGVSDRRVGDIRAVRDRRRLPAGNAMLEIDAVARRHAEQIGRAPDHIVLEL